MDYLGYMTVINHVYAVLFIGTLYVVEAILCYEWGHASCCATYSARLPPQTPVPIPESVRQILRNAPARSWRLWLVPDILMVDHLGDMVLIHCSPATLINLSRTSRNTHAAVESFVRRTYNINRHLTRYFPNPVSFRRLQARTGTLISGSSALQFFQKTQWEESDLDLYVYYESRKEVGWWLLAEGYRFQPNSRQEFLFSDAARQARVPGEQAESPYRRMKGVSAVYTFLKQDQTYANRQLKVQIIVALRCPMDVILNFHSSLVMNVIAWDRAYCLYPRALFIHRTALVLKRESMHSGTIASKYTQRGYTFIQRVPEYLDNPPCTECAHCLDANRQRQSLAIAFSFEPRWIADSHSWVIHLPTEDIAQYDGLTLSQDPCFVTTWQMYDKRMGSWSGPRIKVSVYAGPGFRFQYATTSDLIVRAMCLLQRLYITVPGRSDSPPDCDEELLRYCRQVLKDDARWSWFSLPVLEDRRVQVQRQV